jgi:CHAT domain-containing protein
VVALVADPCGDLPGARAEAESLAPLFDGAGLLVERLVQQDATGAAVRRAAADASLLHYAGHARGGTEPWTAALLLRGDDRLDVADVLALPKVPAFVALSACEGAYEGREATGVAQAFLGRGSVAVVASTRPVKDSALAPFWRALYPHLLGDGAVNPVEAARRALATLAEREPAAVADALALRVLER